MVRNFTIISAPITIVLSLAAWGVSYFRLEYRAGSIRVDLSEGRVWVVKNYSDPGWPGVPFVVKGFLTFRTMWKPSHSGISRGFFGRFESWSIPLWIPLILFSTIFAWSYLPLRRCRKRKELGLCLNCGYDLRGSSERCPECGTVFEPYSAKR